MAQSIFITGAASGIGKATAKLFAERGWWVGAFDVDDAGLAALEAELGPNKCVRGKLDVTSEASWADAVATFGRTTDGHMNALFNCAGILRMGRFDELPASAALAQLHVNVMGPIYGIRASLPSLEKSGE